MMDAWEILTRFDLTDEQVAAHVIEELKEHHKVTVEGKFRAEDLTIISAFHVNLHRFKDNVRQAAEAVSRLLEEAENG